MYGLVDGRSRTRTTVGEALVLRFNANGPHGVTVFDDHGRFPRIEVTTAAL